MHGFSLELKGNKFACRHRRGNAEEYPNMPEIFHCPDCVVHRALVTCWEWLRVARLRGEGIDAIVVQMSIHPRCVQAVTSVLELTSYTIGRVP